VQVSYEEGDGSRDLRIAVRLPDGRIVNIDGSARDQQVIDVDWKDAP
jgi:hypothetical protein